RLSGRHTRPPGRCRMSREGWSAVGQTGRRPLSHPLRTVTARRRPGMSTNSAIEWTEATWNPTTGCDRTSPGCDNCYALTLAKRLKAMGSTKYQLDGDPRTSGPGFRLTVHEDALAIPTRWRTPRMIFVNSM